jgi:hypothetical protein
VEEKADDTGLHCGTQGPWLARLALWFLLALQLSGTPYVPKREDSRMQSPEEARLEFLVGEWVSSDRSYAGPNGPGGTSEGLASYRWEVGGKWLIYDFRSTIPGLGPYEVRGGVSHDPHELRLQGLYC